MGGESPDDAALAKCAAAATWDREQAGEWWRKRTSAKVDKTMVMPGMKPNQNSP